MAEKKRVDEPTGTETVGHEWDGIEELNTPLPRWWLWSFYACIIFAIGYVIVYPAIPLANSATKGLWNWSSRGQLEEELDARTKERAPIRAALATTPIEKLPGDAKLMNAAVQGGASAFKVYCVQCHGSGADGIRMGSGYPNLNDDDWLWGGDLNAIEYTLTHGVRNPGVDGTRFSQMPAFGRDGLLQSDQIADVVSFVRTLSGAEKRSAASQRGAAVFETNCAVCHGPTGEGDRTQGAPNLTDGIWLYGGDRPSITETVTNARQGVMPAWGGRLDPVTIRMLAAYVHSRGGGEAAPTGDGEDEPSADTDTAAPAEMTQ